MPLGLAAEIHIDGDVAAAVDMDMAVPVDFKNGKRQADIDGRLLVRAVVDLVRFVQRLDAFADKDVEAVRLVADDLKANQNVPKRVLGGGHRHLGLAPRGVNEMLDFLAFHSVLPRFWRLPQSEPLARGRTKCECLLVCVGNAVVGDDFAGNPTKMANSANC